MTKVHVGKTEVELDPEHLKFSEATLNQRLQEEASLYSYYAEQLTKANYILSLLEDEYDSEYHKKFIECKGTSSDKLAEASAKGDEKVQECLKKVRQAKYARDAIQAYLRSFDRAHDCLVNLAQNIRKELDKLFTSIKFSPGTSDWQQAVAEADKIIGKK
jgi:hypothetical protein